MQLAIKCYIDTPQCTNHTPTHATVFFDLTNQFNSVSHQEFFDVISSNFPELPPLTMLFYSNPMNVHHTNGKMVPGISFRWRRVHLKDVHSPPFLHHSWLPTFYNPLMIYFTTVLHPVLHLVTLVMTGTAAFYTYSLSLMTYLVVSI